jgi:hypothetical protein
MQIGRLPRLWVPHEGVEKGDLVHQRYSQKAKLPARLEYSVGFTGTSLSMTVS